MSDIIEFFKDEQSSKSFWIFRFGTMHVFATNLILWIRTLTQETLEEITEIGSRHLRHLRAVRLHKFQLSISKIDSLFK